MYDPTRASHSNKFSDRSIPYIVCSSFALARAKNLHCFPQNIQNLEYVLSNEVACIGIYARNINLVYQKYISGFDNINYMKIFDNINNIGKIIE